jgi:hypothetical protein
MSTKHTPGPWMYEPKGRGHVWSDCRDDGSGAVIAVMPETNHGTKEADARLIAAAPELLSALYALLDDVSDLTDEAREAFSGINDRSVTLARAAIAKATGQGEG